MHISGEGKLTTFLTLAFGVGAGAVVIWPAEKAIGWAIMIPSALGLVWLLYHHCIVEMDQKPEFKIEKPASAAIKVDGKIGRYGGKTRTIGYDHAVHVGKDGKIEHFEGEVTAQKNHDDSKGKNLP